MLSCKHWDDNIFPISHQRKTQLLWLWRCKTNTIVAPKPIHFFFFLQKKSFSFRLTSYDWTMVNFVCFSSPVSLVSCLFRFFSAGFSSTKLLLDFPSQHNDIWSPHHVFGSKCWSSCWPYIWIIRNHTRSSKSLKIHFFHFRQVLQELKQNINQINWWCSSEYIVLK